LDFLNNFQDNIPLVYNESSSKKMVIVEQPKTILIYNNQPHGRMELIELQISDPNVIVIGTNGPIQAQIEPYFDTVSGKLTKSYLLVFSAHLKALSFVHFTIQKNHAATTEITQILTPLKSLRMTKYISSNFHVKTISKNEFFLQTQRILVELNPKNGLLEVPPTETLLRLLLGSAKVVFNKDSPSLKGIETAAIYTNVETDGTKRLRCKQEFSYYKSIFSGAYIMALQDAEVIKLKMTEAETFIVSGPLRQIAYTSSRFVKQRLSVNNISGAEENRLHMQLRIDIRKMSDAELVTKFATDMIADDVEYYTDSNGLQVSFYYVNNSLI
uniref:Nucleoporin_N domain-containing protein n=1 Tax=Brugia timori TaxID=42155 RepID=A0A0R3R3E8_9BILA